MRGTAIGIGAALVVAAAIGASERAARGASDEEAAVRAQLATFVAAWNRHDAKALTALHTEDADSTAPWRGKLSGRKAIEEFFTKTHTGTGPNRDSTFQATVDAVRFPTPEVAVTDKTATLTGAYGPDGAKSEPATLEVTEVWKKTSGTWLIYACRIHVKPAAPTGDKTPRAQ